MTCGDRGGRQSGSVKVTSPTAASSDNACERQAVLKQKVRTTGFIIKQVRKRPHKNCGMMQHLEAAFSNSDMAADVRVDIDLKGEIFSQSPALTGVFNFLNSQAFPVFRLL